MQCCRYVLASVLTRQIPWHSLYLMNAVIWSPILIRNTTTTACTQRCCMPPLILQMSLYSPVVKPVPGALALGSFTTWAMVLGEIMWGGPALNLSSAHLLSSSGSPTRSADRWHSVRSGLHLCSWVIHCSRSDKWICPGVAHPAAYTVNHRAEPQYNSSLWRTAEQ